MTAGPLSIEHTNNPPLVVPCSLPLQTLPLQFLKRVTLRKADFSKIEICRVERALCVSPAAETIVGYLLSCNVAIVQVLFNLSFYVIG